MDGVWWVACMHARCMYVHGGVQTHLLHAGARRMCQRPHHPPRGHQPTKLLLGMLSGACLQRLKVWAPQPPSGSLLVLQLLLKALRDWILIL
jgi:hypothetical protein